MGRRGVRHWGDVTSGTSLCLDADGFKMILSLHEIQLGPDSSDANGTGTSGLGQAWSFEHDGHVGGPSDDSYPGETSKCLNPKHAPGLSKPSGRL